MKILPKSTSTVITVSVFSLTSFNKYLIKTLLLSFTTHYNIVFQLIGPQLKTENLRQKLT